MAVDKLVDSTQLNTDLTAVANAIRAKGGTSAQLSFPAEFVSAIEALSSSSILVDDPAYLATEVGATVSKIAAKRNNHTLFIAHITDSHLYKSSNNAQYFDAQVAAMNAVCKAVKPDLVVHGGDMTNGSEAKDVTLAEADHVVKSMREIGGDNTLILIGNHDGNTVQPDSSNNEARRITEAEMKTLYRFWDDGFTYAGDSYQGGQFYGYKDYASLGLRVIRLHSYIEDIGNASATGGMGGNWGYYADELTWFTNVALNTDYDILILCHMTLSPMLQGYAESSGIPHRGTNFQQAIDNWLSASSSHKCVGVIHGHVHWDFVRTGKGTLNVIDHNTKNVISRTGSYGNFREYGQGLCNYLTSFNTADATPVSSYRDVPENAIAPGRTQNTATQALWTAIIVDTTAKQIDLIRFGAGDDLSINYASTDVAVTGISLSESSGTLTEGDTITLTATVTPADATNKSVRWSTSNSAVASVSGGTITAIAAGSATITATTVDGGFTASYALTVQAKPKINQIPLSIESNGNPYNGGAGYKAGYRLNSAGAESALSGKYVTGFIPVSAGAKVSFEGMSINTAAQDNNYIAFYKSDFSCLWSKYAYAWYGQTGDIIKPAVSDNGNLKSITLTGGTYGGTTYDMSQVAYIRVSCNLIDSSSAIYID